MITKEQEIAWKENAVTKKLFSELEKLRQIYFDKIGNSSQAYKPESFVLQMARDAGIIEAINIILTAELSEEDEDKHINENPL